jgi:hypothetical protein
VDVGTPGAGWFGATAGYEAPAGGVACADAGAAASGEASEATGGLIAWAIRSGSGGTKSTSSRPVEDM